MKLLEKQHWQRRVYHLSFKLEVSAAAPATDKYELLLWWTAPAPHLVVVLPEGAPFPFCRLLHVSTKRFGNLIGPDRAATKSVRNDFRYTRLWPIFFQELYYLPPLVKNMDTPKYSAPVDITYKWMESPTFMDACPHFCPLELVVSYASMYVCIWPPVRCIRSPFVLLVVVVLTSRRLGPSSTPLACRWTGGKN